MLTQLPHRLGIFMEVLAQEKEESYNRCSTIYFHSE
jgi:hypothetical protein